jgi:hypothetical protein
MFLAFDGFAGPQIWNQLIGGMLLCGGIFLRGSSASGLHPLVFSGLFIYGIGLFGFTPFSDGDCLSAK